MTYRNAVADAAVSDTAAPAGAPLGGRVGTPGPAGDPDRPVGRGTAAAPGTVTP